MTSCTYVAKGQVWMVYESENMTNLKMSEKSKLLAKTRPYLILSTEDEAGIITAIPITSSDYTDKKDITFRGYDGVLERLKMSQITAIEKKNLRKYMYTISQIILDKVNRITVDRLGLSEFCGPKQHGTAPIKFGERERSVIPATIAIEEIGEEQGTTKPQPKPKQPKQTPTITTDNAENIMAVRQPRTKWTDVTKRSFIKDYDILTKSQLSKKYSTDEAHLNERYDRFATELGLPKRPGYKPKPRTKSKQ